jgi:hypothetical protein
VSSGVAGTGKPAAEGLEMTAQSKSTTHHEEIRRWAAERGGKRLVFLYQEETKGGGTSRFFKLVSRD